MHANETSLPQPEETPWSDSLDATLVVIEGKSDPTKLRKPEDPLPPEVKQLRDWYRDMEENPHGPRKVLPPGLRPPPPSPDEPPPEKKAD